jgi:NAD(P)-dependent dehydrogenase (short-subunit alcohol dehydrogenase family)
MPEQPNLAGTTALVTGATGGIGKHIALGLGRLGAHVIVGARNADKGEATRAEIAAAGGDASVIKLDVASFESIHAAADEISRRYDKLQILVNNAGAWFSDRKLSPDDHELTLATNVLGPHLLNRLLRAKLEASAHARIVNVVSGFASEYDATDLEWERRKWSGFAAYKQSKQALRMLTWGLATRLAGTGITVNAAAPGFVKTDFNQNAHGFLAAMLGVMAKLFASPIPKGAETPLWVATAPELAGASGKFYDGLREKDGKFHEPAPIADLERRLDEMIARARVRAA